MGERLFDRYRLEERLGVGGWAEVWRATDEASGETVALKRLHPHVARDDAARARLRREAGAVAALDHPGIVRVRDLVETPAEAALVVDFVDGEPLSEVLARRGPLLQAEALGIVCQVGEALAVAHAAGIVHRDVKPSNVLVDRDGMAHLIDFGIARTTAVSTLTGVGNVVGTLRYLAPEVLRGEPATPASDVWALGALAYELIERRPPFEGVIPAELVAEEAEPPPVPMHADSALAAVLLRALDPDPVRRPRDATLFVAELDTITRDAPTIVAAAVAPTVLVAAVAPEVPGETTAAAGAGDAPENPAAVPMAQPGRRIRDRAVRRVMRSPALVAAGPVVLALTIVGVAFGLAGIPGLPDRAAAGDIAAPSPAPTPEAVTTDENSSGPGSGKDGSGGGNGRGHDDKPGKGNDDDEGDD